MIAAATTNALEVITVVKQTNPERNSIEMIKKEGLSLFTKGLSARMTLIGMQSVFQFTMFHQIGKLYNV